MSLQVGRGQGFREVVSLGQIASRLSQPLELNGVLDALGDALQA